MKQSEETTERFVDLACRQGFRCGALNKTAGKLNRLTGIILSFSFLYKQL